TVNKRGITLDRKQPPAIAWLKGYLAESDVLLHNLRPGVMDDLGLGSAAITALNPRLVYCNLSAFGPAGPMQKNPGYEPMVQAFAGLFSINGYPDPPGVRIRTSVLGLGRGVRAALRAAGGGGRRALWPGPARGGGPAGLFPSLPPCATPRRLSPPCPPPPPGGGGASQTGTRRAAGGWSSARASQPPMAK